MSESTRRTEAHLTVLRAMRAEGSMMGVPTELEALDAAIAALSVGEKAEAGGGEAVAFYCEHKHRCQWMVDGGYPAWGRPETHAQAWQERHRGYCRGEFHLLYTAPPASAAVPEGYALVPVEPTEAMRTAHAMYGDTSDWWNAVLAAAKKEAERKG